MRLSTLVFHLGALPYDYLTRHPAWREHCAELAAHFPAVTGRRRLVLDLGCGPGVSALALARVCPDDAVVGMDISAPMMRRAGAHDPGRRCSWLQGDALDLPFPAASADAVTGHSFLYLVPDRRRTLQEIVRVLKPGGRLVLLEPTRRAVGADARSVGRMLAAHGPHMAFTMAAWRVAARAAGAFAPGDLERLLESEGLPGARTTTTLEGLGWLLVADRS